MQNNLDFYTLLSYKDKITFHIQVWQSNRVTIKKLVKRKQVLYKPHSCIILLLYQPENHWKDFSMVFCQAYLLMQISTGLTYQTLSKMTRHYKIMYKILANNPLTIHKITLEIRHFFFQPKSIDIFFISARKYVLWVFIRSISQMHF